MRIFMSEISMIIAERDALKKMLTKVHDFITDHIKDSDDDVVVYDAWEFDNFYEEFDEFMAELKEIEKRPEVLK